MFLQLAIKTEKRKRLYYDRFQYAISFSQDELGLIRELPGAEKLQTWADRRLAFQAESPYLNTSVTLTVNIVQKLHETQNQILEFEQPLRFTVSFRTGWLYTNSYSDLQAMYKFLAAAERTGHCKILSVRSAEVTGNPNVIELQKSDYASRIYLKDRTVEPEARDQLSSWLKNNSGAAKPSDGLQLWLNKPNSWRRRYVQRYFYIDVKDPAYQTLFAMTFPQLFRKAMPIVTK